MGMGFQRLLVRFRWQNVFHLISIDHYSYDSNYIARRNQFDFYYLALFPLEKFGLLLCF